MSTQRNRAIRRNTSAVMAILNLGLVFLVFVGVHRLETVLYSRCVSRQVYDQKADAFRREVVTTAREEAADEAANRFVDPATRHRRVARNLRVAQAGQAVFDARVTAPCSRLKLLGWGG